MVNEKLKNIKLKSEDMGVMLIVTANEGLISRYVLDMMYESSQNGESWFKVQMGDYTYLFHILKNFSC